MNTVLVVTTDDRVRTRIGRCLTGFSVFDARDDGDALRMLRLVDIDIVLRESTGPAGALATFVTAARDAAPHSLIVAVGVSGEDEASADFTVSDGFTPGELEAVLRHALERQRLLREIAVMRSSPPAATPPRVSSEGRQIITRLRIRLTDDGRIAELPAVVIQENVTPTSQPYAERMAAAAIEAVMRCTPLQLPATFYANGRADFELTFSPVARS